MTFTLPYKKSMPDGRVLYYSGTSIWPIAELTAAGHLQGVMGSQLSDPRIARLVCEAERRIFVSRQARA